MVALTLISAMVYLVFALGLQRYARARFRSGLDARSSGALVRIGLVDLAAHVTAIVAVSGVLALGLFELVSLHGGNAADLQRAVERMRGVRRLFTEVGSMWSLAGLAVFLVGLAIVTVRRSRTRWREVHDRLVERATQRRMQGPDELPPSPAMRFIIGKLEALRTGLAARGVAGLDAHPEVIALEQQLAALRLDHVRYHASLSADSEADPDEFLAPPARTLRQKFARVFVSRGTFAAIRGPRRWLFAAALSLMLPSSMYVAGQAGVPRLAQRELELEDLRLGQRESAARARIEAFSVDPAPPAWTDQDEAALQKLAELYERATLDDLATADDQGDASPIYVRAPTLARSAARESILRELGRDRPMEVHGMVGDGFGEPHGPDRASSWGGRAHQTPTARSEVAPAHRPPPPPPPPPGERTVRSEFANSNREELRRRPKLWEKLRAWADGLDDAWLEVSPATIRRAALSHAIGTALGDHVGSVADHVLAVDRVQRRYRAQVAVFMDSIMAGEDAAGVRKAIGDLRWQSLEVDLPDAIKYMPSIDDLERRAHAGEWKVWAEARRPDLPRELRTTLDQLHARRARLEFEPRSVSSVVAEYEDHFAVDADRRSAVDQLRAGWGEKLERRTQAVERGGDFVRSGAYRHTGGVVFGRTDFKTAGSIDLVDLTWHAQGQGVALTLVPATGPPIVLEGLSREVVRSALGYAADGRKTVVTISNATFGLQKVLLHPQLIDTAVGCAVTQLDRVVFDVLPLSGNNELSLAAASHGAALELYQAAYMEYFAQGLEAIEGQLTPQGKERLNALRSERTARRGTIEFQATLSADPRAVFGGRGEFSTEVVDAIGHCVSKPDVASCIEAELRDRARARPAEHLTNLGKGHVETGLVSGVRELPYQITPTLDFARPGKHPLPFRFLAQYTVTLADGTEGNPLVLESAQPAIDREVQRWIAAHPAPGDMTIATSASFARLQRLFGAALAGALGPRFPVHRLAELARAMRSDGKRRHRTAAWIRSEVDVGGLGTSLGMAAGTLRRVDPGVADGLARCGALVRSLSRTADLWTSAPAGRWDAACPPQLVDQITGLAESNAAARAAAIPLVALYEARALHRALQSTGDRVIRDDEHDSCAN